MTTYEHPYGFVVCRIEKERFANWQLRVHLWPGKDEYQRRLRKAGLQDQQVHCHGWELRSKVVLGAIEETSYDVQPDPERSFALYRADNDYGPGISRLEVEARGVLARTLTQAVRTREADVLVIPIGTFHASRPASDSMSVTVVLTQAGQSSTSHVVAPPGRSAVRINERRPVPHLHKLLDQVDGLYEREVCKNDVWASFAFIVNDQGEVLMVRGHRRPEVWQPVGGRGEEGDVDPRSTVIREAMEEIGLLIAEEQLVSLGCARRDVGAGNVYFWLLRATGRQVPKARADEVIEIAWLPISALEEVPTYEATSAMIQKLRSEVRAAER